MPIKQLDPRMIDPGKRFTNTDATYISNLTSDNVIATNIAIPGGNSNFWNAACSLVQTNSALWEESLDILPTTTNYLSTNNIILSSVVINDGLTVVGTISTSNAGTSNNWNQAYTLIQANSASWEESADIIPTVTNYLSTNNVSISSLTITNTFSSINSLTVTGNISGNNLRTSFNQASATGNFSFAEGSGRAFGGFSHAEGSGIALGTRSHAEGDSTTASGANSHAEGDFTTASAANSHAEGNSSRASGTSSHAEGYNTTASGNESHAEGLETVAMGNESHAEGSGTIAFGRGSHAAGRGAVAAHDWTYAWSDSNLATLTRKVSTTRTGQYMVSASGGVFIPGRIGIGIDTMSTTASATLHVRALSGIVFSNLPTVSSSSALQGTLWVDGGVLKVMGY